MGKPKGVSFVLFLSLVLPICFVPSALSAPVSSEDDWPMFHHDAGHTSATNRSVAINEIEVLWKAHKGMGGSPIVANGYVYNGDQIFLRCFNASNGEEMWKQRRFGEGTGADYSPAFYGGYVYTACAAYDALSGAMFLNYSSYGGYGSPTVVNDIVYIGSLSRQSLFALNATTGEKIWDYKTAGQVNSSPAVIDGCVYFSSEDDNIYSVDALTGTKIWNYTVNDHLFYSSPVVVDERVYIGATDNFYCLNALTGIRIWNNSQTGLTAFSSACVANGVVYLSELRGQVFALDAITGEKIWNASKDWDPSSPAVAGGVVYVGDNHKILAFNSSTGTKIWNFTFPDAEGYLASTPAIVNNMIYACAESELYAFGIPTTSQSPPLTDEPLSTTWLIIAVVLVVLGCMVTVIYYKNKNTRF
jgi:outer membrane protein assembly factor BamB